VQLLHFTKKPNGAEAFVYAGLCCFGTALHLALVPPTGIDNGVYARFLGISGFI
jgi:hypothetical protein